MSEHEALARFHYGCAARHHKVEIRRLWRLPLHDARTTITFDEHPNQDPALAPKQDLYFGIGRWLTYGQGDLKCRGRVGEVSCAFL
jgi:hypothetical protein